MIELDLRRLQQLRELEERGTLRAVATALGFTPSAVSQQLAILEKQVGVRLIEKSGRGVVLTDAGRLLSRHARVLLSAAEAATADLASLAAEVGGTVSAGGTQSAVRHLLIPAMARLQCDHPKVRVDIMGVEFEEAVPDLRLGTLDVVVADEYDHEPRPRPEGLRFSPLLEEPLRLALPAGHPCARDQRPVSLAALRGDSWCSAPVGSGHHALMLAICRSLGGYEPDLRHFGNDAEVQLQLVSSTGSIALLPALSLPPEDSALAIRDVAETVIRRRLIAVTRDAPAAPGLSHLLSAVSNQALLLGADASIRTDLGGQHPRPGTHPLS